MQRLRVAFVPGVTPDKWARVWRERNARLRLDLIPIGEDRQRAVLDEDDADLSLVRLPVDLERPQPLHCVRLYEEQPVVLASVEHFVAAAEPDAPIAAEELVHEQLVFPYRGGWSPATEQLDWPTMSAADAIETVAAGTGIVIVPMSVARLHQRKDVVQRPVRLPATTIALLWLRSADSDVHQDFVGVTRGRRPRSSR